MNISNFRPIRGLRALSSVDSSASVGGSVAILDSITGAVKTFSELAVKPLLAIAVASGFLLFTPASLVAQLGTSKFVTDYRSCLGLAFVVSCAYLLAHAVVDLFKRVDDYFEVRAIRKAQSQYLRSLTSDEQARLRPYIGEQQSSVVYQITDGVVGGLVGKGILFGPLTSAMGPALHSTSSHGRGLNLKRIHPFLKVLHQHKTTRMVGWETDV